MGDLSIFASRFSINSKSLREFDEALRYFKDRKDVQRNLESKVAIDRLLTVIDPIVKSLGASIAESAAINERSVVKIIRNRHSKEWPIYKDRIEKLHGRLNSDKFSLTKKDFRLLNDIAEALDSECAHLFRRISEKK